MGRVGVFAVGGSIGVEGDTILVPFDRSGVGMGRGQGEEI